MDKLCGFIVGLFWSFFYFVLVWIWRYFYLCVYAEQGSLSPGSHAIVYDMLVIFAPSFVDSDEKVNCQMNLLTKHGINQCCKGMSHSVNRQNDLVQGEDITRLGAFPFHTSCS